MNLILMIAELSGFKLAAHKAEQHKKQADGVNLTTNLVHSRFHLAL